MTFFHEPSTENKGIKVVHPQVDVSSPLGGGVGIAAGWEADTVTGATPKVFGPHVGVDASPARPSSPISASRSHGALTYDRPDAGIGASATPTAGRTTTGPTRCRSRRTTISTTTTSRWRCRTRHNWDSVCDANNAAAASLLDLQALTSSQHCFTAGAADVVTQPPGHRRGRTVAVLDDDAAPGGPGRRHHPDPGRIPIEPLSAACWSAASSASRRSTSRPTGNATPCSRAPPTPSRSGAPRRSSWRASTRTAGPCRR